MEVVLLIDRVRTSIALGESHFREFKSAMEGPPTSKVVRAKRDISRDISSTLVGFANADGGELLVGVEDDGEITGIPERAALISYLSQCYRDGVHPKTPLTNVRSAEVNIEGKKILYLSTMKSTGVIHQTADGKALQRRDLETVPIALEEIHFTRQEKRSQEYDREFVEGAQADELDLNAVRVLADQISSGMTAERCLQYLDLADFADGYLRLRRAALLLFAKEPSKWHPRLQIRIMRVSGNELKSGAAYNVGQDKNVQGNIVNLVTSSWEALRPDLVQTRLTGTAKFESRIMYPEFACREALINAVAHRDYSQEGLGIEIYIFDNRMEVSSPGGLLSSITVDELKKLSGAHQSRNSLVSRALRELGYMREVGEGMRRIYELMLSNELSEPQIESSTNRFVVTLSNKTLYKPEHILWLDSFVALDLSREEKTIVVLGYGGKVFSTNDIWNALGIVDTEHYRQLIHHLQQLGILLSVIPKETAKRQAKNRNTSFRDIPRFTIQPPQTLALAPQRSSPSAKSPQASVTEPDPGTRLFIGNLPKEYDRAEFVKFIQSFDIEGDVVWPRNTGTAFTFLSLDDPATAESAKVQLARARFAGRELVVRDAEAKTLSRRTR